MPDDLNIGFGAPRGQEWALWRVLIRKGINSVQFIAAQIKAFALSMEKRAKTDQIDAELIARFMTVRPKAGRALPDEKLQVLRALTVRRSQMVEARKRLPIQISARRKQDVSAELKHMDSNLKAFIESKISELEQRIEGVIIEAPERSATSCSENCRHRTGSRHNHQCYPQNRLAVAHYLLCILVQGARFDVKDFMCILT